MRTPKLVSKGIVEDGTVIATGGVVVGGVALSYWHMYDELAVILAVLLLLGYETVRIGFRGFRRSTGDAV